MRDVVEKKMFFVVVVVVVVVAAVVVVFQHPSFLGSRKDLVELHSLKWRTNSKWNQF